MDARIGSGSSGSWKTRVSSRMALVVELRAKNGLWCFVVLRCKRWSLGDVEADMGHGATEYHRVVPQMFKQG